MRPFLHMISQEEIEAVHKATMNILAKTGVDFYSDRATGLFKKHGFKVDGNRVYFTEEQVMRHLSGCPRYFKMEALNPDRAVMVGQAGRPVYASGDGYVFIIEPQGRREALLTDAIDYIKLLQTSEAVDITGGNLITATDVMGGPGISHTMLFAWLLSDKPMKGLGYGGGFSKLSVDLARIAFGNTDKYVVLAGLNPSSPLMWGDNMIDAIFEYAEAGQPIEIAPLGMLGTTNPITLAGSLVLSNAETISGTVLIQLIHPGTPVMPGVANSATDMSSMILAMGAPEGPLMSGAYAQICHHYGLPARGGGMLCDAKACDGQAAAESMINLFAPVLAGTDIMFHMCGMCDGFSSFSFEKFILDEDIMRMTKRFYNGICFDEESLAVEDIVKTGPGGHFLKNKKTLQKFRTEFMHPKLMNRKNYESWMASGGMSLEASASKIWRERVAAFQAPDIGASLKKDLWKHVEDNYGSIDAKYKAIVQ